MICSFAADAAVEVWVGELGAARPTSLIAACPTNAQQLTDYFANPVVAGSRRRLAVVLTSSIAVLGGNAQNGTDFLTVLASPESSEDSLPRLIPRPWTALQGYAEPGFRADKSC
jgi:hypothetical protein